MHAKAVGRERFELATTRGWRFWCRSRRTVD
jgi:hypothetical protein